MVWIVFEALEYAFVVLGSVQALLVVDARAVRPEL